MSMKKKLIGIFALCVSITSILVFFLLTDMFTNAKVRTMQDPIPASEKANLLGLREMKISGGPYINFSDLKGKLSKFHINNNIIIVDSLLDNNNCGYYNDISTTYFAYERPDTDVRHILRRLIYTGTSEILKDKIIPESEMAKKHGFGYINIKIESKLVSVDENVDKFVDFVDSLPKDAWVHFHCRLGKGRTSIMLNLFDIMKNAPSVPLNDIVRRQYLLGSRDLFDTKVWLTNSTYSLKALTNRKKFVEDFYAFICQRKNGGIQKWSDWRKQMENSTSTISAASVQ